MAPCIHHCFADGVGTAEIIKLLAACCRGERVNKSRIERSLAGVPVLEGLNETSLEDRSESNHMHDEKTDLSDENQRSEYGHQRQRDLTWLGWILARARGLATFLIGSITVFSAFVVTRYQSLSHSTRLIHFSDTDLARLKASVQNAGNDLSSLSSSSSRGGADGNDPPWITTLDALSALLFVCTAQARLAVASKTRRHPTPTTSNISAQLSVAANVRRHTEPPVPKDYIRNRCLLVTITHSFSTFSPIDFPSTNLPTIATCALALRAQLQSLNTDTLRAAATEVRQVPDTSKVSFQTGPRSKWGFTLTSWREQEICGLEWGRGVGGQVEKMRVAGFYWDGLGIVFPKSDGGGLDVCLALRKDAMRALVADEVLRGFGTWL